MNEFWSYEKKRRVDRSGRRWHFAIRSSLDEAVPYDERPYELFFRDGAREHFGLVRFERRKDNPYRDYEALVSKIMNDPRFRRSHDDPTSKRIWRKSWK